MARLKKSDVERLARAYDDDPVGALTAALSTVTGSDEADWDAMVGRLPVDTDRRRRLVERDTAALDELMRDLIELREIPEGDLGGDGTGVSKG